MSIGFHAPEFEQDELADTSLCELYSVLGQGDTPRLYEQPYELDTKHDWPAGGGMSLDRRRLIIDRVLYQQAMDGEFKATGLTPIELVNGWCRHEKIENVIIVGDNPVDTYVPAHNRALAGEHEHYRACGADPKKVEKIVWPALEACYNRPIKNPPRDAWCGPYINLSTSRDEEILAQLIGFGVEDARRRSKYELRYGFGLHRCDECRNWDPESYKQERGQIAGCLIVGGLVRANRNCDLWLPRDDKDAIAKSDVRLSQSEVDYTDCGDAPEFCEACVHWHGDNRSNNRCDVVRGTIAPRGWCRLWVGK